MPKKKNPHYLFAENMRLLVPKGTNISKLCRDLDINRTQFNRYLNEGAIPNPQVLVKICDHFNVDARIITEPLYDVQMDRAKVETMKSRTRHATWLVNLCQLLQERNYGRDGWDSELDVIAERIKASIDEYYSDKAVLEKLHSVLKRSLPFADPVGDRVDADDAKD